MPIKLKLDFPVDSKGSIASFGTVLLLGSCFAEHQSRSFEQCGFSVVSNPFGIIYNPLSIARLIERAMTEAWYGDQEFQLANERYFHWEHHGTMNYPSATEAAAQSNEKLKKLRDALINAPVIILTFGTSLVFETQTEVVANCHRMSQNTFTKRQLSVESCTRAMDAIANQLKDLNKTIITSISPVRHVRSGLVANNLSKSTLRVAVENSELHNSYFPAFEIFMDELRDYRFAEEDLVHPNKMAQQFIWERFCETYFTSELLENTAEILAFRKFEQHRPRSDEKAHQTEVEQRRLKLRQRYPKAVI